MNDARVAAKVRVQIRRFSGKLSAELPKAAPRMVGEVLHGIQSRGSVLLSEIGSRNVRLPGFERKLTRVVVRGFGQRPLMLLTTLQVTRSRESHWRAVQACLSRWRVEETIRFIKQRYQLEDIRLLSYRRLRSMAGW